MRYNLTRWFPGRFRPHCGLNLSGAFTTWAVARESTTASGKGPGYASRRKVGRHSGKPVERVAARHIRLVLLLAMSILTAPPAHAQEAGKEYPSKPIRLNVPFPAGGGTDIISRVLANRLAETLKQPVIVENKPGAGGSIGVDATAKSAPDGYTLVMGQTANLAINPTLYTNLPYDPVRDLVPVALVADSPVVLVVGAESRFKTLAEIIAAAKAKPGDVTFATPGNGTVAHLVGEQLSGTAQVKMLHVPYKGAAQALTDLMGGRVDMFYSSVPSALAQIKGGKLRAIAVTSKSRSPSLPDVPTVDESGFAGFDATTWFGILAPAKTPQPVIDKLNAEINAALKSPEVGEKIASEGGKPLGGTADTFTALLTADLVKWGGIVKSSGAKVD
jgi:tripartite-type tricarboxylate transporter receptor subunit TctC